MKVKNTFRDKKGRIKNPIFNKISKDIKKLYSKYKKEDIDYDSFHQLICDSSSIIRVLSIMEESIEQ